MGLIGNFFNRGAGALTETAIARALAANSLTDAQARSNIGSASSVAAGLRAIGLTVVADTPVVTPTPTPTAFRAAGTRTQLPTILSGVSTNKGYGFRHNIYFPTPVKSFYVVVPTFIVSTADGLEKDIVQSMRFQFSIDETNPQTMVKPATPAVMWNGGATDVATYNSAAPTGFLKSDLFVMGQSRNWISLYSAMEWVGTPPDQQMPRNTTAANAAGRYECVQSFTVASGVSVIDSGWVKNAATLTEATSSLPGFCPFIVAEMENGKQSVIILGTSSAQGIGATSGAAVDKNPFGDMYGSNSWPARYVGTKLQHAYANFGVSGDQLAYKLNGTNFQRRLALLGVLNPNWCLFQEGGNDLIAGKTISQVQVLQVQMMQKIRTALPSIKFVPSLLQPYSTGAWTNVDGSDQNPVATFANSGLTFDNNVRNGVYPWDGTFGPLGKYIESTLPLINTTRNPNPLVSCDYTWAANGTALYYTGDGRHMNTNAMNDKLLPALSSTSPFQ